MKFLTGIRSLLIGLWLGAAAFFSFAVAPSAFAVLPTRELAGALVSRSLMIVHVAGIVIAVLALLLSYVGGAGANRLMLWAERAFYVLVVIGCAVGEFVIARLLAFTKTQMGKPIDEVAVDDPLRVQFNNLHEYSVWVLVAAMIAALLAFLIVTTRGNSSEAPAVKVDKGFDFDKEFKI